MVPFCVGERWWLEQQLLREGSEHHGVPKGHKSGGNIAGELFTGIKSNESNLASQKGN